MSSERKTVGWGEDKSGRAVRVDWETNTEDPNRGFICHRATAWHDEELQGYLRVAYVDEAEYARHNPTVWHHFQNFSGVCVLSAGEDPREFQGERAERFYEAALLYMGIRNAPVPASYQEFSEQAESSLRYKRLMTQREEFFRFHLNRPYVDYSDVSGRNARVFGEGAPDRRGTGVGRLLYFGAAHALADMGLGLHSSGIQSPEALRIWAKFTEMGLAEICPLPQGKSRLRLNPDLIPESLFGRSEPDARSPTP